MYCKACSAEYPARKRIRLRYGQQKWLNGNKLGGIIPSRARLLVAVGDKFLCIECGLDLSNGKVVHKCYNKSRASGYTASTLVCPVCKDRKPTSRFPVLLRRTYNRRTDKFIVHVCEECLQGKGLLILPRGEEDGKFGHKDKSVHMRALRA